MNKGSRGKFQDLIDVLLLIISFNKGVYSLNILEDKTNFSPDYFKKPLNIII